MGMSCMTRANIALLMNSIKLQPPSLNWTLLQQAGRIRPLSNVFLPRPPCSSWCPLPQQVAALWSQRIHSLHLLPTRLSRRRLTLQRHDASNLGNGHALLAAYAGNRGLGGEPGGHLHSRPPGLRTDLEAGGPGGLYHRP